MKTYTETVYEIYALLSDMKQEIHEISLSMIEMRANTLKKPKVQYPADGRFPKENLDRHIEGVLGQA